MPTYEEPHECDGYGVEVTSLGDSHRSFICSRCSRGWEKPFTTEEQEDEPMGWMDKLPRVLDQKTSTGTWVGHSLVTVLVGLVFRVLVPSFGGAFALGTACAATVFFFREDRDKARHLGAGDYDEDQNKQGVTSRVDRTGDLTGPMSVAAGAVVQYLTTLI